MYLNQIFLQITIEKLFIDREFHSLHQSITISRKKRFHIFVLK